MAREQPARVDHREPVVALRDERDVAARRGVVHQQAAVEPAVHDDGVELAGLVMVVGGDDVAGQQLGERGDRRPALDPRQLDGGRRVEIVVEGSPAEEPAIDLADETPAVEAVVEVVRARLRGEGLERGEDGLGGQRSEWLDRGRATDHWV